MKKIKITHKLEDDEFLLCLGEKEKVANIIKYISLMYMNLNKNKTTQIIFALSDVEEMLELSEIAIIKRIDTIYYDEDMQGCYEIELGKIDKNMQDCNEDMYEELGKILDPEQVLANNIKSQYKNYQNLESWWDNE